MPDKGLLQVVRVACNHNISSYFGSKPYEISKISNIQVFDQRIRESVACYDRHGGNLICKETLWSTSLFNCTFNDLYQIIVCILTLSYSLSIWMPWSLNVRCVQYLTVLQFLPWCRCCWFLCLCERCVVGRGCPLLSYLLSLQRVRADWVRVIKG